MSLEDFKLRFGDSPRCGGAALLSCVNVALRAALCVCVCMCMCVRVCDINSIGHHPTRPDLNFVLQKENDPSGTVDGHGARL